MKVTVYAIYRRHGISSGESSRGVRHRASSADVRGEPAMDVAVVTPHGTH
jgi:hypothetical protein